MGRRPRPASIPCERNADLGRLIEDFADVLKTQSHLLGSHGLSEKDFYQGGLFRGAVERVRGQHIATTGEKRDFAQRVLNFLQDEGRISDWEPAGGSARYDYLVRLNDDRTAAIAMKGCLDGNNTNIFERPAQVDEFVLWSICTNRGADPRLNVWSGVHTRLGAEIVARRQLVDGLIVWDWFCGTVGRPCPKVTSGSPVTQVGPYQLPPPCIYYMPETVPDPVQDAIAVARTPEGEGILEAFHLAFGGRDTDLHSIDFEVARDGVDLVRTTTIRRGGLVVQRNERPTPMQRG